MSLSNKNVKNTAVFSLLLALAVLMGYLEMLIPFSFGIPGIKLGLANFIIVIVLYLYSAKWAYALSILRVLIIGTLFSNYSMVLYSLCGVCFCIPLMFFLKKSERFSVVGVSAGGGVMHNIGQFTAAYIVLPSPALFYYLPFLMIAGLAAGILIGLLVQITLPRIKKGIRKFYF